MNDLKETAKRVFLGTLRAIEPDSLVREELIIDGGELCIGDERIDLGSFREVVMIGMGKACIRMGSAVEALLGERIARGVLVTDRRPPIKLRSQVIVAGHPLPDSNSLLAGKIILRLAESCRKDTLVIFLISGGGSALVESPIDPDISLEDLIRTNQILTRCGASIGEINKVRKQLSRIKGGRLGYALRNSRVIGLCVSDVNQGDIRSVASNPLLPEASSPQEALDIVNRHALAKLLPVSVLETIRAGCETGSTAGWTWEPNGLHFKLLLENSSAVEKAAALAGSLGFRVEVDVEPGEDHYRHVAQRLIDRLLALRSSWPGEPACVISGGEVLCPVVGNGVGGRNQEFVLYSASLLAGRGLHHAAVLSCGTDGIDGNSNAAGAVADVGSITSALQNGKDASGFISASDSHSFFKNMGGLVVTGPTGNNVRDLRVLMARQ